MFVRSAPRRAPRRRRRAVALGLIAAITIMTALLLTRSQGDAPRPTAQPAAQTATDPAPAPPPAAATGKRYSLTEPASPWVVVNKKRPLQPAGYEPKLVDPPVGLNQAAGSENMKVAAPMSPPLEQLFSAAKQDGFELSLASGYRSYRTQTSVYAREVANNGQAAAGQVSARPGYSEHQTGLAADLSPGDGRCVIAECFGQTREGAWVRDNAWRFGFIIRYPQDKTAVTGYSYEPWHVRYVGRELARAMRDQNTATLEEYFKLEAAPGY